MRIVELMRQGIKADMGKRLGANREVWFTPHSYGTILRCCWSNREESKPARPREAADVCHVQRRGRVAGEAAEAAEDDLGRRRRLRRVKRILLRRRLKEKPTSFVARKNNKRRRHHETVFLSRLLLRRMNVFSRSQPRQTRRRRCRLPRLGRRRRRLPLVFSPLRLSA